MEGFALQGEASLFAAPFLTLWVRKQKRKAMEVVDDVLSPVESLVMAIPGTATPMGRAAIFGGAGIAYAMTAKPSMSYLPSGAPRPWIVMDAKNPDAAVFPYWAWGVVPAVLFGVLI